MTFVYRYRSLTISEQIASNWIDVQAEKTKNSVVSLAEPTKLLRQLVSLYIESQNKLLLFVSRC